tara:strand:+ start:144 stop:470 length:327 start_codon:yes stop_codon:yes gene_type:complete
MSINIKCQWLDMKKILVNPDGQVFPCCYLANKYYKIAQRKWKMEFAYNEDNDQIMYEYKKNEKDLNVKNKSMEEVLSHEWYTKDLPESWKSRETANNACINFCDFKNE